MKNKFILLNFILLILFVSACSTGQKQKTKDETLTSNDYYEKAMNYAISFENSIYNNEDDFKRSEFNFKKTLSLDTENPDLFYNLGRLYFYKKDYDNANKYLREAIKYRKNFVEAYSLLIKTYLRRGNNEYALSIAKKANALFSNNDVILNSMATVYLFMGFFEQARDICINIIKKNNKFLAAYNTLGNIYFTEKKYELARFIYLKAVESGEKRGQIYTNLGIIALLSGDKNEAVDLLKKGVEYSPNDSYTRLNLGKYYLDAGDFEGSINEFKTALRINPRLVEAWLNLGVVNVKLKLFDKAEFAYKQALLYDASYSDIYFNYAIFLSDYRSKYAEAEKMYNKFILLKGDQIDDSHKVYVYLKELQLKMKKTKAGKNI